ncbi:hypothetical protein NDA11_002885 [Ustilago hordei]|nr:hypothetical protein NDA11_002885 [Ustilago hordei]
MPATEMINTLTLQEGDMASAEEISSQRSTSRYVFTIGGLVCSWSSQLQPTVANSLVEAEYIALAAAARELLWTSMFLQELEQPVPRTAKIHCQDSYMFENCLA